MSIYTSKRSLGKFPIQQTVNTTDNSLNEKFKYDLLNESPLLLNVLRNSEKHSSKVPDFSDAEFNESLTILGTCLLFLGYNDDPTLEEFDISTIILNEEIFNSFYDKNVLYNKVGELIKLYKEVFMGQSTSQSNKDVTNEFLLDLDKRLDELDSELIQVYDKDAGSSNIFKYKGYSKKGNISIQGIEDTTTGKYNYQLSLGRSFVNINIDEKAIHGEEVVIPFQDDSNRTIKISKLASYNLSQDNGFSQDLLLNEPFASFDTGTHVSTTIIESYPKKDFEYYTVKATDTIESIIENAYYGLHEIVNEYGVPVVEFATNPTTYKTHKGETMFTTPAFKAPVGDEKNKSVLYKFYLDYLYNYNTIFNSDDTVEENGINLKTGAYVSNNDLNNYYNFATEMVDGVVDSYRLNTERFFNYKIGINGISEMTFVQDGVEWVTDMYNVVEGAVIKIPSKQTVDAFFFHLNFRANQMIVDGVYRTVDAWETFFNQLVVGLDQAAEFGTYVVNEMKMVYKTCIDYFTSVYNYITTDLAYDFPRGLGYNVDSFLGLTFGIPVGVDYIKQHRMYRKVTNADEVVICLFQKGEFRAGLDTGTGFKTSIGGRSGNGRTRKGGYGIDLAATVEAGISVTFEATYEFPFHREETSLLSIISTAYFGYEDNGVWYFDDVLEKMEQFNILEEQYVTKVKIGNTGYLDGMGIFALGDDSTSTDDVAPVNKTIQYRGATGADAQTEATTKSGMNFSSVAKSIKQGAKTIVTNASGAINVQINLGFALTYTAKYNNNPLVPESDARVPSEIAYESEYFVSGALNLGPLVNLFEWTVLNTTLRNLLMAVNFNKGAAFKIKHTIKRDGSAKDFTNDKIEMPEEADLGISSIFVPSELGKAKFNGKEVYPEISIASFAGAYDDFAIKGCESYIVVDFLQWHESVFEEDGEFDLIKTLSFINAIGFKDKIGFSYNGFANKKMVKILKRYPELMKGGAGDFLESTNKSSFAFDLGAALGIEYEFKFNWTLYADIIDFCFRALHITVNYPHQLETLVKAMGKIDEQLEPVSETITKLNPTAYYTQYYALAKTTLDFVEELIENENQTGFTSFTYKDILPEFLCLVRYYTDEFMKASSTDNLELLDEISQTAKEIGTKAEIYAKHIYYVGDKLLDTILGLTLGENITIFAEFKAGISVSADIALSEGAKVRLGVGNTGGVLVRFDVLNKSQPSITQNVDNDSLYFFVNDLAKGVGTSADEYNKLLKNGK